MTFDTKNPYERDELEERVRKLIAEGATVEVKRKAPRRSTAQNRYLHVLLGYFGAEHGMSADEVKVDIYKRTCNRDIFERKAVNRRGKEVTFLRSTADLTTEETALSIERFRNWSSAVAGVYLPAPDEEAFLAFCEREAERNREFI